MEKIIYNVVIVIVLVAIALIFNHNYTNLKETNKRLIENISQINTENSQLNLTNNELREYLKYKDTNHKQLVDSILKVHRIKIKDLKNLQTVTVSAQTTDTVYVTFNDSVQIKDSLFVKRFDIEKECVKLTGTLTSKDINSSLSIDYVESNNKVFITESYKRSFWDLIFFRKGKLVKTITADCGQATVDELNVIN